MSKTETKTAVKAETFKMSVTKTNPSGVNPLEFKVVVRPHTADAGVIKSSKTNFTLIKPVDVAERDEHASMEGELIAISPTAFTYEPDAPVPKIGSTVMFARYSGITYIGADGLNYRMMNDKDVVGVRT